MLPRFADVTTRMPRNFQELQQSPEIGMETRAERRAIRPNVPEKGVYVLHEDGRPLYVGRSDTLADRLLVHGQPSGGSETASFAFNLAKEKFPKSDSMTRRTLQADSEFKRLFDDAKTTVRKMKVRTVRIDDPIEQTIFEVYAHM